MNIVDHDYHLPPATIPHAQTDQLDDSFESSDLPFSTYQVNDANPLKTHLVKSLNKGYRDHNINLVITDRTSSSAIIALDQVLQQLNINSETNRKVKLRKRKKRNIKCILM